MLRAGQPTVSVIVPMYNMQQHIEQTLQSALDQTIDNFEIIVVDDGSTDLSVGIVSQLADRNPRIRLIQLEANSNLPAIPRNVGIENSSGEFLAFLDHDDVWKRRKLERQLQVFRNKPSVGLVHSHLLARVQGRPLKGYLHVPNLSEVEEGDGTIKKRNPIMTSSVVVRRSVIEQVGLFDPDPQLRTVEDYHLWLRVRQVSKVAYLPEIHGNYRAGQGASSTEDLRDRLSHVDAKLGTSTATLLPEKRERYRAKLLEWPKSAWEHVAVGSIRQSFGMPPRIR